MWRRAYCVCTIRVRSIIGTSNLLRVLSIMCSDCSPLARAHIHTWLGPISAHRRANMQTCSAGVRTSLPTTHLPPPARAASISEFAMLCVEMGGTGQVADRFRAILNASSCPRCRYPHLPPQHTVESAQCSQDKRRLRLSRPFMDMLRALIEHAKYGARARTCVCAAAAGVLTVVPTATARGRRARFPQFARWRFGNLRAGGLRCERVHVVAFTVCACRHRPPAESHGETELKP